MSRTYQGLGLAGVGLDLRWSLCRFRLHFKDRGVAFNVEVDRNSVRNIGGSNLRFTQSCQTSKKPSADSL